MKGVISFYGKPQCQGNRKQKTLLREAGYLLEERNILTTKWEADVLSNFFTGVPIQECINPKAPQIKSGELDPGAYSAEEILEKMIQDPILIKRPLIFFRGEFCCGFDTPLVERLLGQDPGEVDCGCSPN